MLDYNNMELQKSALDFICRNAYKIIMLEEFTQLTPEAVEMIIKKDEVQAYDEMQVYEAVMSFKANRSVWISSIGLAQSTSNSSDPVSVKVKIGITKRIEENGGDQNSQDKAVAISKAKHEVLISSNAGSTHVPFVKPVKINGGEWYTISVLVRVLQGTYNLMQYSHHDQVAEIRCGEDEDGEDDLIFEFEKKTQAQFTEIGYQLEG